MSDSSHERKRVVQSIFLLLRHVVENLKLTVSHLTLGAGAGRSQEVDSHLCTGLTSCSQGTGH